MANIAEDMIENTLDCFINNDIELAELISETDDKVDKLNSLVFKNLMNYVIDNPKEADIVIGYIFISKNIERLADHLENIAQDVIFAASGEVVKHG